MEDDDEGDDDHDDDKDGDEGNDEDCHLAAKEPKAEKIWRHTDVLALKKY